jgi:hypothetical protein
LVLDMSLAASGDLQGPRDKGIGPLAHEVS